MIIIILPRHDTEKEANFVNHSKLGLTKVDEITISERQRRSINVEKNGYCYFSTKSIF